MAFFSKIKREQQEICEDILQKLEMTKQVYIVGHDVPLSISKGLFTLLNERRKMEAKNKGVPEEQYEFEDVLGLFLGLGR